MSTEMKIKSRIIKETVIRISESDAELLNREFEADNYISSSPTIQQLIAALIGRSIPIVQ